MSIETDLKKDGIEVIEELNIETINLISKRIANKIFETFNNFYLNPNEIFNKLCKLNMYKAKMPEGMAEAVYFYKNSSIYFNEHIANEDLEEFAIHECIHFLQENKDENGKLVRMGHCIYKKNKPRGMGLNEASVQYMAAKIIGITPDFEKYYGINLMTPSPSYYPLECALLKQITYFIGDDILFKSTLFSNDEFKDALIKTTSKEFYYSVVDAFDEILELEEKIINSNNKLAEINNRNIFAKNLTSKIDKYKDKIATTFMTTQNLIISGFFDINLKNIRTLEEIEYYRKKLYKFSDIIGTMPGYSFFDNYYVESMNKLEHMCNILENGGNETALEYFSYGKFRTFLIKFKNFFSKNKDEQTM